MVSLCVYCGSQTGNHTTFQELAYELGKLMAQENIRLVYGGGDIGLMGAVCEGAMDYSGKVTGIIPSFLISREGHENNLKKLDEVIVTQNMHERKMLMYKKSDGFIALPGGMGTLEELVEQLTWAQLGQHKKPIVVVNYKNFWQPFFTLINHMRETGFIYAENALCLHQASGVKEAIKTSLDKIYKYQ